MSSIGDRIKLVRQRKGMTQVELAKQIHVSSQVVSNWERNYHNIKAEDLASLACALNVSIDYLVTGASNRQNESENDILIRQYRDSIGEENFYKLLNEVISALSSGTKIEEIIKLVKIIRNLKES